MLLTVQSSGKVLSSTPITIPKDLFNAVKWKVYLREDGLTIIEDADLTFVDFIYQSWAFTIIVELIASGMLIGYWAKRRPLPVLKILGTVLLANLLSYPVAWWLIPSLGQFQDDSARKMGLLATIGVGYFTVIAIAVPRRRPVPDQCKKLPPKVSPGKFWVGYQPQITITIALWLRKNSVMILAFLSIPFCLVCLLMGIFKSSYENYKIHVSGLPVRCIIPLAEAYAVGFESLFVYALGKKALTLRQAAILGLLANAASYLLGTLLL